MKLIEFKSHKDDFDNEYKMSLIKTKRFSLFRIILVTNNFLSPFYAQLSIGQGSLSNLYCYVYKWGLDITIFPIHYSYDPVPYSDPEFKQQMEVAKKVMNEDVDSLKALGD